MHRLSALLLVLSCTAVALSQTPAGVVWPGTAWERATGEPAAITAALARLDADARAGVYGLIDAVFVARNGRALIDATYPRDYDDVSRGRMSAIGCGAGCADASRMHQYNYFHPNWHPYAGGRDVHTLQSVTKSIAATAIGIAIGRGEIAGVDRPIVSFFTDRDLSGTDPRLQRVTLEQVLTMQSGIEWHEGDRPLDETNTTVQLEWSQDWIGFTLRQPMDADPGTKWTYNSGGSQLLSGVIRSATGRFIDDYSNDHLFRPIGIRTFHWKRTPTGHPDTEGGLYLRADDLARIGYLYLHDGVWSGRRVLPDGWVRRATTRHAKGVAGGWDYGYQWWITSRQGVDIWAGRGFGGQFLVVIPDRNIVAAVTAWNVFGLKARGIFEPLVTALIGQ